MAVILGCRCRCLVLRVVLLPGRRAALNRSSLPGGNLRVREMEEREGASHVPTLMVLD